MNGDYHESSKGTVKLHGIQPFILDRSMIVKILDECYNGKDDEVPIAVCSTIIERFNVLAHLIYCTIESPQLHR